MKTYMITYEVLRTYMLHFVLGRYGTNCENINSTIIIMFLQSNNFYRVFRLKRDANQPWQSTFFNNNDLQSLSIGLV